MNADILIRSDDIPGALSRLHKRNFCSLVSGSALKIYRPALIAEMLRMVKSTNLALASPISFS